MTRMIRKQIYIESHQEGILKQKANSLGITEAEVIRRAIDGQVASARIGARDPQAWEQEKRFIARRMTKGRVPGVRRWKREDAYEERLTRYGRQNHR